MSRKRTEIISPDREKVAALLHSTSDPRDKERLIAARMAMTGQHTLSMIAEAVGRARSCIQGWLHVFETGGVEALLRRTPPPGRPPSLSPEVKEQLHQHLSDGTWRTAREMRRWLKETHQIDLTLKGCYYWLGKSRGVLKAPRPCHHQQAPGAHHAILWDGAGFHQPPPAGAEGAGLEKVHVLKLPLYCLRLSPLRSGCPEINPTEKIRDRIKDAVCNTIRIRIQVNCLT